MITIEQCRAARGLLGWTQQDLADVSGLSKTAINNFEKGHSDIKRESLAAIQNALENAGIQFLENNGLCKRTEDVKILRGETIFQDLLLDIKNTAPQNGGEVLISDYNSTIDPVIGVTQSHNLSELSKVNAPIRVLCSETDQHLQQYNHRTLPTTNMLQNGSFIVYGNKVALQPWQQKIIIVIDSLDVSMAERHRFEALWKIAQAPKRSAAQSRTRAS